MGLDHRFDFLDPLAETGVGHARLVTIHPVDIAFNRVDLAIVSEHPEGLGQVPGRKGVGRIALVIDREIGDETFIQQIGIKRGHLFGQEHALVDDRPAGQRADVKIGDLRGQHRFFDAPADDVEIALKIAFGVASRGRDHDLLDLRPRDIGFLANHRNVHRHLAPAIDGEAVVENFLFDDGPAALLGHQIGARQEHHANRHIGVLGDGVPGALDMLAEKVLGNLQVDTGAVTGLAVGVDRAAMPNRLQRLNPGKHHLAPRFTVNGGDEADPAGVVLIGRIISVTGGQTRGVGAKGGDFLGGVE